MTVITPPPGRGESTSYRKSSSVTASVSGRPSAEAAKMWPASNRNSGAKSYGLGPFTPYVSVIPGGASGVPTGGLAGKAGPTGAVGPAGLHPGGDCARTSGSGRTDGGDLGRRGRRDPGQRRGEPGGARRGARPGRRARPPPESSAGGSGPSPIVPPVRRSFAREGRRGGRGCRSHGDPRSTPVARGPAGYESLLRVRESLAVSPRPTAVRAPRNRKRGTTSSAPESDRNHYGRSYPSEAITSYSSA